VEVPVADCGDGGCSCRILSGDGVTVSGSGTLSNPYVVSSDFSGIAQSIQVNDTPTVNLTLRGAGTPTDPLILSADTALKMTQLSDVADPEGGPQVGETPVWVGSGTAGHWEFKVPPAAPAGAVNVGVGLGGVGDVGNPIYVKLVSNTPGLDTGTPVYVDSVGNLRITPPTTTSVDWSSVTNKPTTFPPATHTHTVTDISNPSAFTGAKSVGNALKVMDHQIFTGSTTPVGPIAGDLWFKKAA